MAETVKRSMELMTPELLEIKKSGLFNDEEISTLTKRLNQFQYRINKVTKQLADFKDMIEFMKHLLREIRYRSRKTTSKLGRLEVVILKRIQFFYDRAFQYFSIDFNFCMDYLGFLIDCPTLHNVTADFIKKMIEKFHSEPSIFQIAAVWFKKHIGQKEAINVLFRGLACHPQDQHLYLDIIELELSHPDKIKEVDRFKKYIESILKNIPDYEILIHILTLLEEHPRLVAVQHFIMDKLIEKYPFEEKVLHIIAVMELKGCYYQATPEELERKSTRYSIQRCIARYKAGILKLPFKKKAGLWYLYLDTLIELQKDNPNVANVIKANSLKEALQEAKNSNIKLEEIHWKAWMDICANDEELMHILGEATRCLPSSVQLWTLYLKFCLGKKDFDIAEEIFERAIKSLGHKAVGIWEMYITTHDLQGARNVETLYRRAVSEPYEEIAGVFKKRFLTWMNIKRGLKETRLLYFDMAVKPPYSKELHREMIQFERMEKDDFEIQLKVYELYAKQFGQKTIDVWIEWITSIREQNAFDQNEKVAKVFKNAIKALPEELANDFKEKFNELEYGQI